MATIKIPEDLKEILDKLKISKEESYGEVILRLIYEIEKIKRSDKKLLIEGCKVMAEDSLRICKEWEAVDAEWPE